MLTQSCRKRQLRKPFQWLALGWLFAGLALCGAGGHAAQTTVTRGPYLQMGTPNCVTLRWRTSAAQRGYVRYGLAQNNLNLFVEEATATTEHSVTLNALVANTTYFYSVGTSAGALVGGDAHHYFVTAPLAGAAKNTRIWVLGDSGTANADQRAVRDAYYAFNGARYTDLWLMLGDNAYVVGTDSEYQAAVFDVYQNVLRQSVLWPTLGNHDTAGSPNPPVDLPYYQIFDLPQSAEAGGLASGTEDYYSFDYGNIHFVCLDSMTSARTPDSPMLTWLQNDLAANGKTWLIAYWHHPPYSKGSHNSDTEIELVEMRQNVLPILESYGVDLVLTGHSHSYERSFLLDGHYGLSTTLTNAMKKDGGDGRIGSDGAYTKPTLGPGGHEGAVYAVAGSSGQASGGALNHPAMFISLNNLGSIVLDVNGDQLEAQFIRESGVVDDRFTMLKGAARKRFAAPSDLTGMAVSRSRINLSWEDNADDEIGFKVERSTNGISYSQVGVTEADKTTFSDAGLARSTFYYYRVRAYRANGDTRASNTIAVRTSGH